MQEPGAGQSQQPVEPSMQTPPSSAPGSAMPGGVSSPAPIPSPTDFAPRSMMDATMMQGNTSGMGTQSILPDELKGFNWGALVLSLFWSISHNTWIGLLCLVPYLGLIMNFVLGFKGNEWAWQNRKWDSIEHFRTVQGIWRKWAMGFLIFYLVIIVLAILLPLLIGPRSSVGG